MSVRPHPTEPHAWIIDCWPNGRKKGTKRERIPFRGTEAEALAMERELMRSTKNPAALVAPTLNAFIPEWSFHVGQEKAKTTHADVQHVLKKLKPAFGPLRPNHITPAHIDRYKSSRMADGVKKRTVNKELSYLSALLKFGVSRGYCNPLPFRIIGFPAKQTKAPKPHPLHPEDITAMYQAIEPEYRLIFLSMTDAGLRISEALHLKREDLDLRRGVIYVRGKGGKERIVPIITDRLRGEITAALEKTKDGYLSVNRKGKPYYSIRKALNRAATAAGIKHVYHHLLRHSFATIATVAGMAPNAIQALLGHSDLKTTMLYQHIAVGFLRDEGRKFTVSGARQNEDNGKAVKTRKSKTRSTD